MVNFHEFKFTPQKMNIGAEVRASWRNFGFVSWGEQENSESGPRSTNSDVCIENETDYFVAR